MSNAVPLSVRVGPPLEVPADCLIAFVAEGPFSPGLGELDGRLGGLIGELRTAGDLTGKTGERLLLPHLLGVGARRLLLVGLGQPEAVTRTSLHNAAASAIRHLTDRPRQSVSCLLPDGLPLSLEETALAIGVGLLAQATTAGLHKREAERFVPRQLILVAATDSEALHAAVKRAGSEGRAVQLARHLVNLPPADLYPETFAQRAHELAAEASIECTVLEEARLKAERMGALLAVARGSERPPRLVVLRYRHGGDGPTLGLVGKGVTFDSGGLSLKPSDGMLDMKCDMAGAAAVLAAIIAVAELRLPVNLLGILPLVENMPSGKAYKLGDVLTARTGTTIEIHNTDAEGRLILADALAYAVDLKANHLVDLATLTGACMVALGNDVCGVMTNHDAWGERVLASIRASGELGWPLPQYPLYDDLLKSSVADLKNIGGRFGGAVTAGKFLARFVGTIPWAHLDIAGPAWAERDSPAREAGGTGFGVRSLVQLAHAYAT